MCQFFNFTFFYNSRIYTDYVISKTGIFRKHLYGARSPFTFRCTITCVPRPHKYNVVELPWSIGCTAYEPYIMNKLHQKGFKYKDAHALIYRSIDSYDPTISEILDELVEESSYKEGLPVSMQRNQNEGFPIQKYIDNNQANCGNISLNIHYYLQLEIDYDNLNRNNGNKGIVKTCMVEKIDATKLLSGDIWSRFNDYRKLQLYSNI